ALLSHLNIAFRRVPACSSSRRCSSSTSCCPSATCPAASYPLSLHDALPICQAGLNLAMELEEAGFLKENGVRLIGTTSETIKKAEDRLEFKATMEKIGEPVAASLVVENVDDGLAFANKIGYPVVLRPAYTLGGSGGGIAHDSHQLVEILENGLRLSRVGQVLVERCIAGWKEIEYEVMRDSKGNCITVCNMENIDPVG